MNGTLWACRLISSAHAEHGIDEIIYVEILGTYMGAYDATKIAVREFARAGRNDPRVELTQVESPLPAGTHVIRAEWKGSDYAKSGSRKLVESVVVVGAVA